MKVPLGGRPSNDGYYGGFGSKPAKPPWTPPVHHDEPPAEPTPRRFRGLRLRRTRRARMAVEPAWEKSTALIACIPIFLLVGIAFLWLFTEFLSAFTG